MCVSGGIASVTLGGTDFSFELFSHFPICESFSISRYTTNSVNDQTPISRNLIITSDCFCYFRLSESRIFMVIAASIWFPASL
jgi:hypothetical protein